MKKENWENNLRLLIHKLYWDGYFERITDKDLETFIVSKVKDILQFQKQEIIEMVEDERTDRYDEWSKKDGNEVVDDLINKLKEL